jgi:hypothetical protein
MVQVGSQKYIRVFKFLFSYFVNQLKDDLHLSHMTQVGGKKTNTHTHTKRWANLFFLIRIWQIPLLPHSPQNSKISRIFNLKKIQKNKKKNPPNLLVFIKTKFVPKKILIFF